MKVFELILKGFNGETDETDDLIKWVSSDENEEETLNRFKTIYPDIEEINEIEHSPDVDGIDHILKNGLLITGECEIINGKFSWILNVDGESIPFQGGFNADYFEKHYKELGYKVIRKNENTKV